jgi:hypothetical protein
MTTCTRLQRTRLVKEASDLHAMEGADHVEHFPPSGMRQKRDQLIESATSTQSDSSPTPQRCFRSR